MFEVELMVLKQAMAKLDALKCQYKIITPDGQEFGTLEIVRPKTRTRTYTVPHGTSSSLYKGRIENLNIGDVVTFTAAEITAKGMTADHFRESLRPAMIKHYGNGSQATMIDAQGNVETMRLK